MSTSKVRLVRRSISRIIVRLEDIRRSGFARAPCDTLSHVATAAEVRDYWDRHIHDLEVTRHPVGSRGFFDDLDHYHFEKLHHLLRLVPFDECRGRRVLDVGCGAGVDLARFAKGGAEVAGVDISPAA